MKNINQLGLESLNSQELLNLSGGSNWFTKAAGFIWGSIEAVAITIWDANQEALQEQMRNGVDGYASTQAFK